MSQLGLIGLGTMGANLARNAAHRGAKVAVFNRTVEKVDAFMKEHGTEGNFVGCTSIDQLLASLESPRPIVLMVKAGQAVDDMIAELVPYLDDGDIIIDAGNSHYRDTERRIKELVGELPTTHYQLQTKKIRFIGMGVSGGEEGALHGPSMMPGGDKQTIESLMLLLTQMSADDGLGGKCVTYVGPGGAGHFVKMVHNGIEYGIMQLIAESYDLLKRKGGLSNAELADVFGQWSVSEELRSFLMEITASIFRKKDDEGSGDLLDSILDKAGQKGTGKWTTDAAMYYGVSIPTITAAVDARIISSGKDFRVQQSRLTPLSTFDAVTGKTFVEDVKIALELSIANAYAQGFQLLSVADAEEKWNLNISEIARIWLGGCIIRSSMLDDYRKAFSGDATASQALRDRFNEDHQKRWRQVVSLGAVTGIPLPAMSSALWYYDSYRTERLPQHLIQAQRDFFGAHTFERTDKEGSFHANWHNS